MMHVDLSFCQPPALDFAGAAQRDEGRNSELRERLEKLEAAASDPDVVRRLVDDAMEHGGADGTQVDEDFFRDGLHHACKKLYDDQAALRTLGEEGDERMGNVLRLRVRSSGQNSCSATR